MFLERLIHFFERESEQEKESSQVGGGAQGEKVADSPSEQGAQHRLHPRISGSCSEQKADA